MLASREFEWVRSRIDRLRALDAFEVAATDLTIRADASR